MTQKIAKKKIIYLLRRYYVKCMVIGHELIKLYYFFIIKYKINDYLEYLQQIIYI